MNVRPEYNFKTIGSNLKNLRQSNRLTVEQVREYLCLGSVQAIYKWERGEGLPQADTLFALMELYRVTDINTIKGESAMLSPVYVLAAVIYFQYPVSRGSCLFYLYASPLYSLYSAGSQFILRLPHKG